MTNITIALRRWADIQVGDVVRDRRWRWQRWETITKIEHTGNQTEAWYREESGHGYPTGSLELVEVQVTDD